MEQSLKKPIRNYSKLKPASIDKPESSEKTESTEQTESTGKSAVIATSVEEESLERRIIDSDGQVYIVLPTATETSFESDDSIFQSLADQTFTPQQNGTSSYRARNHYTRMTINGEDRDVCNEEGCTQSFRTKTSTSHKKKHTMMHLRQKWPEMTCKPELSFEEKVNSTAKLITSANLPLSIVENRYFRQLTGLELTESFIRNKIADLHTPNCPCPFMSD